ncbi:MAG: type II secretion system secretin GspD [Alphaproteobacteria bacterium]|nr:type II secretion system secretin GspD [Alphaproteobacteria bacterium]
MLNLLRASVLSAHAQPPLAPEPAVRTEEVDGGLRVVPDREVPVDAREARALLLEFGETSLYDLTLFFADVMRMNFLIADDEALKGKSVQLIGHESMTIQAAWEAYLSALRAHGFTTAVVGDLVTLVPSKDASKRPEAVRAGKADAVGTRIVTQLLPVENGEAGDLLQVVKPLLSTDAEVFAYAPANTLIVTDSESNVRKVSQLVDALSVAAPATTLRVVHVRYAEATQIKAVIEALYAESASTAPVPAARPSRRGAKTPAPTPTSSGSPRVHITKVLDDERTNSLVVLADEEGHAAVDALLVELDVDGAADQRLHVLRLKYALAEEVEAVLTKMGGSGSTPEARRPKDAPADLSAALEGARFAADTATNSLAVLAAEEDFLPIEDLVRQLDVARRQVFVDALFVELTENDSTELGMSGHVVTDAGILSSQPDIDASNSFSVTSDLLSGLAAGVFGELVEVLGPTGDLVSVPAFGIALRALASDQDVHVMGNPGLLVVDHGEAVLSVGRTIPYRTGTTLTGTGLSQANYDRLDVNMELLVTPHINDDTLVTLAVELTADEVDESAAADNGGPTTSNRQVETDVMVEDGQTIVIAGVTSTKMERVESKVPLLGDLPLIGALFRSHRKSSRSTNLLVFLTPYVVDSPSDLLRIRRIKEAQRQEFVRRFQDKEGQEWLDALRGLLADAEDRPAS